MLSADTLAGRHILVTGGGTGLGRSMARRFVELGARVTICGRRAEVLAAAAAELGPAVAAERCDVRDHAAVEAMLDRIWARAPLDVLVNNAAGNLLAQSHRLSPRAVDAVLDIVLKGSTWCTLGAGRRWIEAGRGGTVLSILTLSALQGGAFTLPSAMAKAGVLAMTKSLAVEWGPKGIRLVAIAPGNFPTPMPLRGSGPKAWAPWSGASRCAASASMPSLPSSPPSSSPTWPRTSPGRRW
ncbi:SDR family NAD(P)-dependent oxidoreductase [Dankookia sp. P2]|uniref:SDR family NAD(P)-dependent oxidoreductase n=1 Tax=Dankookia sp. P2 TaxID=3423955 RepID=UPI003D678704